MKTNHLSRKVKNRFYGLKKYLNRLGGHKTCNICQMSFHNFSKYDGGEKRHVSDFVRQLEMIDSDFDNFGCMYCNSHDRERHLFLFFDVLELWETMKHADIIHFSPEKNLSKKIKELKPRKYITADLFVYDDIMQKIDVTKIPYPENSFDFLLCNHVLEHVENYISAMNEIFRVLKPGGKAILQTPLSGLLAKNYEDKNLKSESQKKYFYGQKDHVRIFSKIQYLEDLQKVGFKLNITKSSDLFHDELAQKHGFNKNEDLIMVTK